jgi:hypothetical protein
MRACTDRSRCRPPVRRARQATARQPGIRHDRLEGGVAPDRGQGTDLAAVGTSCGARTSRSAPLSRAGNPRCASTKDLMSIASGDECLRYAQDDGT